MESAQKNRRLLLDDSHTLQCNDFAEMFEVVLSKFLWFWEATWPRSLPGVEQRAGTPPQSPMGVRSQSCPSPARWFRASSVIPTRHCRITTWRIKSVHFAFRKKKQENALYSQRKSQPEKAFLVAVWAHLIHPKTSFLAEIIKAALRLSIDFEMVCGNMELGSPLLFDQMKSWGSGQLPVLLYPLKTKKLTCILTSTASACSTFPWFQIQF